MFIPDTAPSCQSEVAFLSPCRHSRPWQGLSVSFLSLLLLLCTAGEPASTATSDRSVAGIRQHIRGQSSHRVGTCADLIEREKKCQEIASKGMTAFYNLALIEENTDLGYLLVVFVNQQMRHQCWCLNANLTNVICSWPQASGVLSN